MFIEPRRHVSNSDLIGADRSVRVQWEYRWKLASAWSVNHKIWCTQSNSCLVSTHNYNLRSAAFNNLLEWSHIASKYFLVKVLKIIYSMCVMYHIISSSFPSIAPHFFPPSTALKANPPAPPRDSKVSLSSLRVLLLHSYSKTFPPWHRFDMSVSPTLCIYNL